MYKSLNLLISFSFTFLTFRILFTLELYFSTSYWMSFSLTISSYKTWIICQEAFYIPSLSYLSLAYKGS